jgi:hypothetical protein
MASDESGKVVENKIDECTDDHKYEHSCTHIYELHFNITVKLGYNVIKGT